MNKVNLLPKEHPWHPLEADEDIIYSIRALMAGAATDRQQRIFWEYLMFATGCGDSHADLSFRPGGHEGDRATSFAEGRRFVGLQIRKFLRPEYTPHAKPDPHINPARDNPVTRARTRTRRAP